MKIYAGLFVLILSVFDASAIMFNLNPNTEKCLKGQMKKDDLIIGTFSVSEAIKQKVDYIVKDSKGNILSQNKGIDKGKFTIVVESDEIYEICFTSKVDPDIRGIPQEVSFSTKVEVKNFESLGEALKLKPMEVELMKVEQISTLILKDFEAMRESEIKMSNTNESTNNRVVYFSFLGVFILFSLSVWQVFYFRKFFKSKKLIE